MNKRMLSTILAMLLVMQLAFGSTITALATEAGPFNAACTDEVFLPSAAEESVVPASNYGTPSASTWASWSGKDYPPSNAVDGNPDVYWITSWDQASTGGGGSYQIYPQWFRMDFKESAAMTGIEYQAGDNIYQIKDFEVWIHPTLDSSAASAEPSKEDGWVKAASGICNKSMDKSVEQISFDQAYEVKTIHLIIKTTYGRKDGTTDGASVNIGELRFISAQEEQPDLEGLEELLLTADHVKSYIDQNTGMEAGDFPEGAADAVAAAKEKLEAAAPEAQKEAAAELNAAITGALAGNQIEGEQDAVIPLPMSAFHITANTEDSQNKASNVADGNTETIWHSAWENDANPPRPHSLTIDLGRETLITNVSVWARSGMANGLIKDGEIFVGTDEHALQKVKSFGPMSVGTKTSVDLPYLLTRYVRIDSLSSVGGTVNTSLAEVSIATLDRGYAYSLSALKDAWVLANQAQVGVELGMYKEQSTIDAFKTALGGYQSRAEAVVKNSAALVLTDEINASVAAFQNAANSFTKEDLRAQIDAAEALLSTLTEENADRASLQALIAKAEALYALPDAAPRDITACIQEIESLIALLNHVDKNTVDLSGAWDFKLGGYTDATIVPEALNEQVILPGSLDENRKGTPTVSVDTYKLNRKYVYTGPATFQKKLYIPAAWEGETIRLFMERSRVTKVWINGEQVLCPETSNTLASPQIYDIGSALRCGENNTITIVVDNSYSDWSPSVVGPIKKSSMATDETQTNWNGIVGKFELLINQPVYMEALKVFPNQDLKTVRVDAVVRNTSAQEFNGTATFRVDDISQEVSVSVSVAPHSSQTVTIDAFHMGDDPELWDEFSPFLYTMQATLSNSETKSARFGMRLIGTAPDTYQLTNNGKRVFLRGESNCGVFPITGYAPMDLASWEKLMRTYKAYGLNLVRFHTWCPPQAAFDAADEVGIYLQPELSNWGSAGGNSAALPYYRKEAEQLLDAYANNPSFIMLAYGNEESSGGVYGFDKALTPVLKEKDPTRFYSATSDNQSGQTAIGASDDFNANLRYNNIMLRGSAAGNYGFVYEKAPSFTDDNSVGIHKFHETHKRLILSHEVGEFQVFPNYNYELQKYTGVLAPRNLEYYRELVETMGQSDKIDDYVKSSGMTSMLSYKLEMEAALKTPDQGGCLLLGIQDFSGQGIALVGMMDSLGDPKHGADITVPYEFSDPARFKSFCDAVVPMADLDRFGWENDQALEAPVRVANYGGGDVTGDITARLVEKQTGTLLVKNTFSDVHIPQGTVQEIGALHLDLSGVASATLCTLELVIDATQKTNTYDVVVYPGDITVDNGSVYVTEGMNDIAKAVLEEGGKVLLAPKATEASLPNSVRGLFATDFWTTPKYITWANRKDVGTMGLLMDPAHAVFSAFPTQTYADYYWGNIMHNSRPMNLNGAPEGLEPLIRVISGFGEVNQLGTLVEAKVGNGKIIISSLGLNEIQERFPEARHLQKSILDYMNSDAFDPDITLTEAYINTLVTPADSELLGKEQNVASAENGGSFRVEGAELSSRLGKINDGAKTIENTLQAWTDWCEPPYGKGAYSSDVLVECSFPASSIYQTVLYLYEAEKDDAKLPATIRLEYWDGDSFLPVKNQSANSGFVTGKNTISFDPITTTKLRAVFQHAAAAKSAVVVFEFEVYKQAIPLEGLKITTPGGVTTVKAGETLQLGLEFTPAEAATSSVYWRAVDEASPGAPTSMVSMSQSGLLTANTPGTALVTASLPNSDISADISITILPADLPESGEKQIISFVIGGEVGVIDEAAHTITVAMPEGANLAALTPTIEVSEKAAVEPAGGAEQDFTKPVIYTVTAEDGTVQRYTVTVTTAERRAYSVEIKADRTSVQVGEEVNVTVTARGGAFVGAACKLSFESDKFTVKSAPDGWETIGKNSYGYYNVISSGFYPEDTVLGDFMFTAKDQRSETTGSFALSDTYVAGEWEDGWSTDDAEQVPNNGSVDVNITLAPAYVVEIVDDYVAGYSLILVYTNNETGAYAYGGEAMYDVTGAGYLYKGTQYARVYGLVVSGRDADPGKVASAAESAVRLAYSTDVNGSNTTDLNDAVAVVAVYNANEMYMRSIYMDIVLKADVNGDKKVDVNDFGLIKAKF